MLFNKMSKDSADITNDEEVHPLLPLRDIVVFPYMVVPLFVGREKSIKAMEDALKKEKYLFLSAQKNPKTNAPSADDIFRVGTLGTVLQLLRLPDGTVKVLVEGKKRGKIKRFVPNKDFFLVSVDEIEEYKEDTKEVSALVRSVRSVFETYVKYNRRISQEMLSAVLTIEDPARLSDTIVAHVILKLEDKQDILETFSSAERLEKLLRLIESEIEILEIEKKIKNRVKKQMEKTQKEYYLNEQMRAIQKEMGEKDEFKNEL